MAPAAGVRVAVAGASVERTGRTWEPSPTWSQSGGQLRGGVSQPPEAHLSAAKARRLFWGSWCGLESSRSCPAPELGPAGGLALGEGSREPGRGACAAGLGWEKRGKDWASLSPCASQTGSGTGTLAPENRGQVVGVSSRGRLEVTPSLPASTAFVEVSAMGLGSRCLPDVAMP